MRANYVGPVIASSAERIRVCVLRAGVIYLVIRLTLRLFLSRLTREEGYMHGVAHDGNELE